MEPEVEEVMRRQRRGARAGVEAAGMDLLGYGSSHAPIKEGHLRASGSVVVVETIDEIEAVTVFDTPYAAIQHEREDFVHPIGGEAKYLERRLQSDHERYERLIQASIARAVEGGL